MAAAPSKNRYNAPAVHARRRRRPLKERLKRLIHYRLMIPVKRSTHSPAYSARSVCVGVVLGLTPTVGLQMTMSLIVWLILDRLFKWRFNVVIAMAWTWISNLITFLPMYYVFYITGHMMLGHWDDVLGYHSFVGQWDQAMAMIDQGANGQPDEFGFIVEVPGYQWLWLFAKFLLEGLGLSMLVGCIPFAVVGGWLSYRWSYAYSVRHRERKRRKQAAKKTEAVEKGG